MDLTGTGQLELSLAKLLSSQGPQKYPYEPGKVRCLGRDGFQSTLCHWPRFSNPERRDHLRVGSTQPHCPASKTPFIFLRDPVLGTINICWVLKRIANTSLAAKGALTYRLQRRTACKIQNARQGAPKWRMGSGMVSTPRLLGILSNFR